MEAADSPAPNAGQNTPGEALRKLFMTPLGVSAYRLSSELGVAPIAISQVLRGKRAISPSMALKLGSYFGVEPGFWMALQAAHDLQVAAQEAVEQGAPTVTRCPALDGRSLVLRETKLNGKRQWEVLMVSSQDAAPLEAKKSGAAESKAKKSKTKNSRSVAAKQKPKSGSRR